MAAAATALAMAAAAAAAAARVAAAAAAVEVNAVDKMASGVAKGDVVAKRAAEVWGKPVAARVAQPEAADLARAAEGTSHGKGRGSARIA